MPSAKEWRNAIREKVLSEKACVPLDSSGATAADRLYDQVKMLDKNGAEWHKAFEAGLGCLEDRDLTASLAVRLIVFIFFPLAPFSEQSRGELAEEIISHQLPFDTVARGYFLRFAASQGIEINWEELEQTAYWKDLIRKKVLLAADVCVHAGRFASGKAIVQHALALGGLRKDVEDMVSRWQRLIDMQGQPQIGLAAYCQEMRRIVFN